MCSQRSNRAGNGMLGALCAYSRTNYPRAPTRPIARPPPPEPRSPVPPTPPGGTLRPNAKRDVVVIEHCDVRTASLPNSDVQRSGPSSTLHPHYPHAFGEIAVERRDQLVQFLGFRSVHVVRQDEHLEVLKRLGGQRDQGLDDRRTSSSLGPHQHAEERGRRRIVGHLHGHRFYGRVRPDEVVDDGTFGRLVPQFEQQTVNRGASSEHRDIRRKF